MGILENTNVLDITYAYCCSQFLHEYKSAGSFHTDSKSGDTEPGCKQGNGCVNSASHTLSLQSVLVMQACQASSVTIFCCQYTG